jgi:hypothetical protein
MDFGLPQKREEEVLSGLAVLMVTQIAAPIAPL